MFFDKALDLANVLWKANMIDGTEITPGPQTYIKIDRNILESFELTSNGKSIFKINTKKKTLVHRMKTFTQQTTPGGIIVKAGKGKLLKIVSPKNKTPKTQVILRIKIIALLEKNKNPQKNIKYEILENNKIIQEYEFDPKQSMIYYYYHNGKIETRDRFSVKTPYTPIKLRSEELTHLNG